MDEIRFESILGGLANNPNTGLAGVTVCIPSLEPVVGFRIELRMPLAFSIDDLVETTSISRSVIYEEARAGNLVKRKVGDRRAIVTFFDVLAWLATLPKA